jgi:uncharacterized protein
MSGVEALVSFGGVLPDVERDFPRPERLVRGNPERRTWNRYSDPTGRFHAGEWACEPGAWRIEVASNLQEFCTLHEGRVRLTDDAGRSVEFGPGDSFVLPGGFQGTWDTLEPLRKTYVIVTT